MTTLRIALLPDPPAYGGAFAFYAEVQALTPDGWVTVLVPEPGGSGEVPIAEVGDDRDETINDLRLAFSLAGIVEVVEVEEL